ncbi:hypothetical protein STCU_04635 [Strigomonas culicis]|uniref:Uncharacterized protein n=1 Tax=Strigomonas culicis TaxID=28005 RepID=S9UKH8_9TRYP|nr:hypothetical protein STCU_04635 [Strigomonas culicis]|eukprot:EPY29279.1 hypothetical protein STCU_04635 [Strigomonas culicis]
MLSRSTRLLFSYLVREIDPNGFVGDYKELRHVGSRSTQDKVRQIVKKNSNALFCGHYHTGKLTLLKAIGEHFEKREKKRVAYVSGDSLRANRLDGYLLPHFIGLRISRDELPSQEQLEGTLERHARLVESTYNGCYPSLCTADVLILDALEKVAPVVLLSMDAVARRQRGVPSKPFGGLRVFAAADFWRLPVHPTSDTGGYAFQLAQWGEWFPVQQVLHHTHGQDPDLSVFTEKALYGTLTLDDMLQLEARSMANKREAQLLSASTTAMSRDRHGEEEEEGEEVEEMEERQAARPDSNSEDEPAGGAPSPLHALRNDNMISNVDSITKFTPRFPKQPTVRVMPTRYRALKQLETGNYLVNLLVQSSMPASFGLVDSLSVVPGNPVHLLLDGQAAFGVAAGAVGEVLNVKEHYLTVHFIEAQRTVDLPRMRVVSYHPDYPEVRYELQQFPVFPRQRLCPLSMVSYGHAYRVNVNGRRMADTNDLGNLLSRMRTFEDFTLRSTSDFAHLDGMVHEPTRIYYHQIEQKPLSDAPEQWCRNCKSFIAKEDFFDHWNACVHAVRWCSECSKTIPLEILDPHMEKHQIVMCMDCGQGVEWRQWEAHRLSCGPMMREVSADNEFLPLRTRQLALELGLDKRDLHTMRSFSRSMLPKSR